MPPARPPRFARSPRSPRAPSTPSKPLRVGDTVRLRVEDLAFGEDAVCRHEGYVVFVPRVLPGEVVEARVTAAGRKYGRAEPLRVLEPSPARVAPRCRHFGTCGGCTWQHLRYDAQARTKEDLLRRLLAHEVSAEAALAVVPIARAPEPWGFREKVQLAVSGRPGALEVGFYRLRSREVVDIQECPVQPPEAVEQVLAAKGVLDRHRVRPFDEETGRGALRNLVLRRGRATGDAHLVLVSARADPEGLEEALEELRALRPALSGASLNRNDREGPVVLGHVTRPLFGRRSWRERVGGLEFEVGPTSFFQTNARAAEVLVEEVRRAIPAGTARRILDLYAGVGLFALALARGAGSVLAVEEGLAAVRDGERNARRNGIRNCRFLRRPVETALRDDRLGEFDAAVADPPREGLSPGVLPGLVRGRGVRRLALVSCDPPTLARDLRQAVELGGRVERVLPVDMFPHTHHLEAVATVAFPARGAR